MTKLSLLLPLLLAPVLLGQSRIAAPAVSLAGTAGLHAEGGELMGAGRNYKVHFGADDVAFSPALGRKAPHNLPLQLRVTAIGRGTDLRPAGAGKREHGGLRVSYHRTACEERYDILPEGVEQSFVFDRLPPGEGDLVVVLRLQTELPVAAAQPSGVRFEQDGLGGVSIGAVTGVDALGARADGELRLHENELQLRLPAAFVATAALPLVLDPFYGTSITVATFSSTHNPAVAYSSVIGITLPKALVVFERVFSATDTDVYAQRLDESGALAGSVVFVAATSADERKPAVAAIRIRGQYIVVHERGRDIYARAVALDGALSSEIGVATGADSQTDPDLGSDLTTTGDNAVCVWNNGSQLSIQSRLINYSALGVLSTSPVATTLANGSASVTVGNPRIAHTGGDVGRYLVVYSRRLASTAGQRGVVVDGNLNVLSQTFLISGTAYETEACVDGNGTEWVVAFASETASGSGDRNIRAVPVFFDPLVNSAVAGAAMDVTALVNVDEFEPAVGWLSSSCMVGWRRRAAPASSNTELYVKTVDAFTCAQCEPALVLANSANVELQLAMAGGYMGLIVYESTTAAGNGDILGIRFDPADGSMGPLAGAGCSGVARASCARVGNSNFRLRLRESLPAATTFLVLSTTRVQLTCGGCTLSADPYSGFIQLGMPTDARGNAEQAIPIPATTAMQGVFAYTQWVVVNPGGGCPAIGADFSSSLFLTIE